MDRAQTTYTYEKVEEIAKFLLAKPGVKPPKIGIICGTGLGGLADTLVDKVDVEYKDIPSFPISTVKGHAGKLVFGNIGKTPVVCMKGRFHMYEGYSMSQVTLPVRVMKLMGIKVLCATNAAGNLNKNFQVGDLMIIKDHIFFPALGGFNPLVGPNDPRFGPRFHGLSDLYSRELKAVAEKVGKELNITLREGVYAMNAGPSFESVAECKMMIAVGADVVGMSTCPEAVVAAHAGLKVFGMSLLTNDCILDYSFGPASHHEQVLSVGESRGDDVKKFFLNFIKAIPDSTLED